MTPAVGSRVRLVRVVGAAGEALRLCVGEVGEVEEVRPSAGPALRVLFRRTRAAESWWVRESEIEVVA